jgi:transposase
VRFLQRFEVPFGNNLAERAVRAIKVKLKLAGGFRALIKTEQLRGRNPFEALRVAFG